VGDRGTYHHGALREALLAGAFHVLETEGLASLSLRKLAEAAGVSKTAPYRHFTDKRDLLLTVAGEGFRLLADAFESATKALAPDRGGPPATGGLRALMHAYIAFARARPALYRLMFSPMGYSLHSENCRIQSERAIGMLVTEVAAAQASGWRSSQEGRALVLSLWAEVHGWAGLIMDGLLPAGMVGPEEDLAPMAETLLS
jgi:AcrR family transcriptional regulator